jgi:hypothetical protein
VLRVIGADLEGVALQANGEAGQGLVASTGLGDNGQLGHGAGHVSAGHLDAIGRGRLKGKRARGGSGETAGGLGRQRADDALGWPSEGRAGQHCDEGQWTAVG